jgi:hypothetical protein
MAAGIARLEAERVVVRMRLEGAVRVCGKPVVVLGMVVVRVLVGVECRHRAGKGCQSRTEQNRCQTPHGPECM